LSEELKKTMKTITQAEIPNRYAMNTDPRLDVPPSVSFSVGALLLETLLVP
jgi:hypothetical protein